MMTESTCRCRLHQSRNPVLSVGISPPIGFGEIPHNLNLVHKSLLYILPCLLYLPDLGVDAVDIGIVTPLGNIAILISCSADSVSVNYLHRKTLLIPLHHPD